MQNHEAMAGRTHMIAKGCIPSSIQWDNSNNIGVGTLQSGGCFVYGFIGQPKPTPPSTAAVVAASMQHVNHINRNFSTAQHFSVPVSKTSLPTLSSAPASGVSPMVVRGQMRVERARAENTTVAYSSRVLGEATQASISSTSQAPPCEKGEAFYVDCVKESLIGTGNTLPKAKDETRISKIREQLTQSSSTSPVPINCDLQERMDRLKALLIKDNTTRREESSIPKQSLVEPIPQAQTKDEMPTVAPHIPTQDPVKLEIEQALLAHGVQALRAQGVPEVNEAALSQVVRAMLLASHSQESLRVPIGDQAYVTNMGFRAEVIHQWQQSQIGNQVAFVLSTIPAASLIRSPHVLIPLALVAVYLYLNQAQTAEKLMELSSRLTALMPSRDEMLSHDSQFESIPRGSPVDRPIGFTPLFDEKGPWTTVFPDHSNLLDKSPLIFPIQEPSAERWINPLPEQSLGESTVLSSPIRQLDTPLEGYPIEQGEGLQFMYRKNTSSTTDRPHAPNPDVRYHQPPETLPAFPDAIRVPGMTPDGLGKTRARWLYRNKIYEWDKLHGELEVYDSTGKKHLGSVDHITGAKRGDSKPGRNIRRYVN